MARRGRALRHVGRVALTAGLLGAAGACPGSSSAPAGPPSLFLTVVPPGSNGNSAGGSATNPPRNFEDQLTLYGDLSYAKPGLTATSCEPPTSLSGHQAASNLACNYYKDGNLQPQTVASTETVQAPSGNPVTIQRDGWGVPFVSGATRADAFFGVGYASAEDRLWLYDILRNIGRGTLSEFLGPADGYFSYDSNMASVAGYSEDELTAMTTQAESAFGSLGPVFASDMAADIAGINAYIDSLSTTNASKRPPEYTLIRGGQPPAPFVANDIVASAILIQSLFAGGGGGEHTNELLLQKLDPTFGPSATQIGAGPCALWRDFRHADDPDTPRTIAASFAQSPATLDESCPQALAPGAAIWDVGSFTPITVFATAAAATTSSATVTLDAHSAPRAWPVALDPVHGAKAGLRAAGLALPDSMSNFIAVNADQTTDGHPIAVMGPQTSYFVPQLVWEVAVHSSGGTPFDLDGRGIVFGHSPYINIGHTASYAWSATSGESDLIDLRVSKTCNMDGSATSLSATGFPVADGYLFDANDGQGPLCRQFYTRTDTWTAAPTFASTAAGGASEAQTVTRTVLRTHYGNVFATATVGGVPVVVSRQRSTFRAELHTTTPFALMSANVVHSAGDFQRLFNGSTGTFNWLYVDSTDVGYLHSGLFPVRDPGQDPDLPVWGDGRFEWQSDKNLPAGYFTQYGGSVPFPARVTPIAQGDPSSGDVEWQGFMPMAQHPQAINPPQGWIASWNNSPAAGWWAADATGRWGPTHRVAMLGDRLAAVQAAGKFDVGKMVEVASDTAFTDIRAEELLPLLLQIMQAGTLDATQTQVVTMMQAWIDAGSGAWISGQPGLGGWRRDRNADGVYDQRAQVVLMDAWFPHLIDALLPQITAVDGQMTHDNPTSCNGLVLQCRLDVPGPEGSAFEFGYHEFMRRLLQTVLAVPGHHEYRELLCAGTGIMSDCRNGVLTALDEALADLGGIGAEASWDGTTLYNAQMSMPGDTVEAYDAVQHQAFGLLTVPSIKWLNRPTFQQVVEVR
jgi:acyl-homoserine lactone acylase PvdQ